MVDKIKLLEHRLREVADKFNALKKCGIDEEILIVYIQSKTKLSQKKVKKMLSATEEFYNKLIAQMTAEAL